MKKKLISTMALSLCLCMGAMVGCGDDKNSSSSSSSGSSPKEPLTKDEILAEIGDAYEATKAYKGDFTITATGKDEDKGFEDEEAEVENYTMEATVDPSRKLMYNKESRGEAYYIEKLFKNGEDYIQYEVEHFEEGDDEYYTKYTEACAAYKMSEYTLEFFVEDYISAGLFEIESVDAYNSAYAKVIADSVAELAAGKDDEESPYYGMTGSATATINTTETEAGAYVLTMKMMVEVSNSVEQITQKDVDEMVITAKDGKLVGIKEVSERTITKAVSDSETQTRVSKYEENNIISYAFDQAKYDSVSVTVPETVEGPDYYRKAVTVLVNGMELEDMYASGDTIQNAVNGLVERVRDDISVDENSATVTLYTDATYTQALDGAALTEADFYALNTVYAKVELKEGYALVNEMASVAFGADVTAEQKTVVGMMLGEARQMRLQIRSVDSAYFIGSEVSASGTTKVLVNGTAYTEDELTMESGETYTIEYVSEMAKADLNIFIMF